MECTFHDPFNLRVTLHCPLSRPIPVMQDVKSDFDEVEAQIKGINTSLVKIEMVREAVQTTHAFMGWRAADPSPPAQTNKASEEAHFTYEERITAKAEMDKVHDDLVDKASTGARFKESLLDGMGLITPTHARM